MCKLEKPNNVTYKMKKHRQGVWWKTKPINRKARKITKTRAREVLIGSGKRSSKGEGGGSSGEKENPDAMARAKIEGKRPASKNGIKEAGMNKN